MSKKVDMLYRINDLLTEEFPDMPDEKLDALTHIIAGHIEAYLNAEDES